MRKKITTCGTCLYRESLYEDGYEVLLVRSKKRTSWGIPKGHREPGETIFDCAMRETIEETGFTPELEQRLPDVVVMQDDKKIKTLKSFLARQNTLHDVVAHDGENAEVRWFHYDKLPAIVDYQAAIVETAITILKNSLREKVA